MKTLLLCAVLATSLPALAQQSKKTDPSVDRGRYLIKITGCNDCHTAGYAPMGGKVPEAQWLTGDALGWRGPWGTTYPINLRLYMQELTEEQWVKKAKTLTARPPMPWFNLHDMSASDLRAIYHYVRYLGAAGKPAPTYVPPDKTPAQPYVQFPEPPK
jgi:mono/diheme cytochrome c family protein